MKKILLSILTITALTVSAQDTIYVNQNATGANDGTSWTDAYADLIDATAIAGTSKQIWVAAGTYKPSNIGDRDGAFKPKTSMYGGFNGTETQLSQRDWIANPTILSGDIGVLGDQTDNSQSVIEIQYAIGGASIVIDGFTISDGYADGAAYETRYGGGIYIRNFLHPVTISNCLIKDNSAHYEGGLHYSSYNAPSTTKYLTIENTRFTNNYARSAAAFSVIAVDTSIVNVTVANCLIDENQTIGFPASAPNSPGVFPGGRFTQMNFGEVNGDIVNCTFAANIDNSTIPDSSKSVFGIQNINTAAVNDIDIYNTIFYGNTINPTHSSIGFGTSLLHKPSNVNVYNTISEDVMGSLDYVTSTNNTQVDPLFTNPSSGDFTLQNSSPAINTGDTTSISQFIPLADLAGNTRFNGNIDIGCYENQLGVGISDFENTKTLSVYPNPTTSQLTINTDGVVIENVSIIDITGKTVKTIKQTNNTINVSDLVNGIYFLQVQTKQGLFNSKFIKE